MLSTESPSEAISRHRALGHFLAGETAWIKPTGQPSEVYLGTGYPWHPSHHSPLTVVGHAENCDCSILLSLQGPTDNDVLMADLALVGQQGSRIKAMQPVLSSCLASWLVGQNMRSVMCLLCLPAVCAMSTSQTTAKSHAGPYRNSLYRLRGAGSMLPG